MDEIRESRSSYEGGERLSESLVPMSSPEIAGQQSIEASSPRKEDKSQRIIPTEDKLRMSGDDKQKGPGVNMIRNSRDNTSYTATGVTKDTTSFGAPRRELTAGKMENNPQK